MHFDSVSQPLLLIGNKERLIALELLMSME